MTMEPERRYLGPAPNQIRGPLLPTISLHDTALFPLTSCRDRVSPHVYLRDPKITPTPCPQGPAGRGPVLCDAGAPFI